MRFSWSCGLPHRFLDTDIRLVSIILELHGSAYRSFYAWTIRLNLSMLACVRPLLTQLLNTVDLRTETTQVHLPPLGYPGRKSPNRLFQRLVKAKAS